MQSPTNVQPEASSGDAVKIARRLVRERDARLGAEMLVEKQKKELSAAAQDLAHLLSGGVKDLNDVLSMARPELFQKAAKIQRWARQIAPKLEVERPWELDLAAMLYPLGAISLPNDLAKKYALCESLDAEEKLQIDECSQIAYELISNIPRMEMVAEAVLYSRKGYDGTGFRGTKFPRTRVS